MPLLIALNPFLVVVAPICFTRGCLRTSATLPCTTKRVFFDGGTRTIPYYTTLHLRPCSTSLSPPPSPHPKPNPKTNIHPPPQAEKAAKGSAKAARNATARSSATTSRASPSPPSAASPAAAASSASPPVSPYPTSLLPPLYLYFFVCSFEMIPR